LAHSSLREEFDTVFDQTCFNRFATHFNISMFGQQTMFDDVWSPNISRLGFPFGQALKNKTQNVFKKELRHHIFHLISALRRNG